MNIKTKNIANILLFILFYSITWLLFEIGYYQNNDTKNKGVNVESVGNADKTNF